jgi:hypothetical protein
MQRQPLRLGLVSIALIVLPLFSAAHALAASKTWDGGCGGDTAWSCAANWRGDVAPGPHDTAIFSATSAGDSTVDAGFDGAIAAIKINAGYDGTVSLARSLTVLTQFSQRAGTFTAGDSELTAKSLALFGGSFTASSDTTSIGGSLKISGTPTFDADGGTVDFGGGGGSLSCDGVAFNLVTFTHAKGTKTVGSDCDLPLGENPEAGRGGSIVLNGALSGNGVLTTSGKLTLGGTGTLARFSGLVTGGLTLDGRYDFGDYADFTVHGPFVLRSGARFTAPAGTASFSGNFTTDKGAAFDANGGMVAFDATAGARLSCADTAFNLVSLSRATGGIAIGSDCDLPLGENPTLGEASVNLSGVLSGTGTLTAQRSFKLNSTSRLDGFRDLAANSSLIVTGATADFGSYESLTVNGNFSQTGGVVAVPDGANIKGQFVIRAGSTFNAPSGTVTIGNRFAVSPDATFNADGGTVTFGGYYSANLSCGNTIFNLVTFTHVTGIKIVGSDCNLPLGRNPVFNGGGSIFLEGTMSGTGILTIAGTLTRGPTGRLVGLRTDEELQAILELLR